MFSKLKQSYSIVWMPPSGPSVSVRFSLIQVGLGLVGLLLFVCMAVSFFDRTVAAFSVTGTSISETKDPSHTVTLEKIQAKVNKLAEQESELRWLLEQLKTPIGGGESGAMPILDQRQTKAEATSSDDLLSDQVDVLSMRFQALMATSQEVRKALQTIPSLWPVDGIVTSGFGYRPHPIYGEELFHQGVDIAAWFGTPVYATADGIVQFSGWNGGYGNVLILDHSHGFATVYGHLERFLVDQGASVKKGQQIALVGSTGLSTGPHLHYEVRRYGHAVVPNGYMRMPVYAFL